MALQFRGLSSIIREQLSAMEVKYEYPLLTEEAMYLGQSHKYYTNSRTEQEPGVFRWGYSIWGIDQITGVSSEDG